MSALEIRIVRSSEELYPLRGVWEALQVKDDSVTYYSTFEYVTSWWEHCGNRQGLSLFVICVLQDDVVVGIAPLVIRAQQRMSVVHWRELVFMGIGDFRTVLVDSPRVNSVTVLKECMRCIEMHADSWDRVLLTNIPHHSRLGHFFLRSVVYRPLFRYQTECPYVSINEVIDITTYGVKSSDIRYYKKRLAKEVGYTFHRIVQHTAAQFEAMALLHKKEQSYLANDKGNSSRYSLYSDSATEQWIRELYLSGEQAVTFTLNDPDGRILAYFACFAYKGTIHFWNHAYDPAHEKYSLGKILASEVLDFLKENGDAAVFDFGAGGYAWKYYWTNKSVVLCQLDYWVNPATHKRKILRFLKWVGLDYSMTVRSVAVRILGMVKGRMRLDKG